MALQHLLPLEVHGLVALLLLHGQILPLLLDVRLDGRAHRADRADTLLVVLQQLA